MYEVDASDIDRMDGQCEERISKWLPINLFDERESFNESPCDDAPMLARRILAADGLTSSQTALTGVTVPATAAIDHIIPRSISSPSSELMKIYRSPNLNGSNHSQQLENLFRGFPNCNLRDHEIASVTPYSNNNVLTDGKGQFHSLLLADDNRKMSSSGTSFDYTEPWENFFSPQISFDRPSGKPLPTQNSSPNNSPCGLFTLPLNIPFNLLPSPTYKNNGTGVGLQNSSTAAIKHDFENPFETGYSRPDVKAPNHNRSPMSSSGVHENGSKAGTAWSSYSKPCVAHAQYPTRLFCKTHHAVICCVCVLKTIGGQHSTCSILPKRSVLPDSQTRLQASKMVDSLAERLLMKLGEHGASDVLVPCPHQHLAFNTSLESRYPFRISPALSDFMIDVNSLIETLSTSHRRDLEALTSRITNCLAQFERLPDFQEKLPPYLPNCSLHGQGITHAYKSGTNIFFVSVRDDKGRPCHISETELKVIVKKTGEDPNVRVEPYYMPGIYKVSYSCSSCGICNVSVTINGELVPGSPFQAFVEPIHEFSAGALMVSSLGDVQNFNKPWGVCVDNQGNYITADRCNNCVKVYSYDWKLKCYFPEEGTPYSLKKPAGIALDRNGHIVVTDKDNHRVQVFTVSGVPLRRTDSSETTFSFPWGIAVNSKNQYIVTHSKCRVKILSSNLETLHEIPMGSINYELNPRAVSIGYMDEILITEFEGGNVYTLDVNNYKFRLMTRHHPRTPNQVPGVKRYQGIAVDRDGYILVCDSKNRVVEVHNYAGDFIDKWTVPGKPVFIVPLNTKPKSYLITLEEGWTNLVLYTLGGGTENVSVDL